MFFGEMAAMPMLSVHYLWQIPLGIVGLFLTLILLAFLFLWVLCLFVDQKKPQEKDNGFYRGVMILYIRVVLFLARIRVHTTGLEKTPKTERFLLVCNHLSEADPAILLKCFRKSQLAFITKRENTSMFIIGPLMHKTMCQPINRENDREALKTILNCIRLIQEDQVSIAVFPEGYIRPDRLLRRFRSGVFKIAQKTKVPIVVCTLRDSEKVFHNFLHLKPSDVDMHLIRTIQPEEYASMSTVELGDWIYRMMAEDLGPDRVAPEQEETP